MDSPLWVASRIKSIKRDHGYRELLQRAKHYAKENFEEELYKNLIESRVLYREDLVDDNNEVEQCIKFGEAETITYNPPITTGGIPKSITNRPEKVSISQPFVSEIRNVQLVGPYALPITSSKKIIIENVLRSSERITEGILQSVSNRTLPVRQSCSTMYDTVISLIGPWYWNYYHWNVDYLSRLQALKPYFQETGKKPLILLPEDTTDWMIETLRLAGINENDWEIWNGQRAEINRLVIPSSPTGIRITTNNKYSWKDRYYRQSPNAQKWLRNTAVSNVNRNTDIQQYKHIFVSRKLANSRKIKNIEQIRIVLDEYNFEIVCPEQYTPAEQVAMFTNADTVVGPTGAGLTNALFSENINLIIIYADTTNPVYYAMGEALGFDIGVIEGETVSGDIVVNPNNLKKIFESMNVGQHR